MSQFGTMSDGDVAAIKARLLEQINAMTDAEIEIAAKSEDALAFYIANAFKALAAAIGYIVALPLAWAGRVAKSLYDGFKGGWAAGMRSAGFEW
jgi:hypothetical protein